MIKVIYHANCTDGFCSAFLLWQKYGDAAQYIPFQYSQELKFDNFNKDDEIYIVDFSFKRDILTKLASLVKKVVVLDHHKTAKEELGNPDIKWPHNTFIYFDMDKSGVMMTWYYLNSSKTSPKIVDYIQDRDLWKFELPNSNEICAYLQALPFEFARWQAEFVTFENDFNEIVKMGQAILLKLTQQIDQAVKHGVPVKLLGYRPWAVNSTVNFSEVAGELAKKGDFGIAWFVRSDGKYQYSLRSTDDKVDVSEVAKQFGGGGHRNAAGFESNNLVFENPSRFLGEIIKYKNTYVYIYGYDPTGVNPFVSGLKVPHYMVYECTETGEKLGDYFNITETEMEGLLE